MGKTRAAIKKAYRERQKQKKGESYLKSERERVKNYYKSCDALSEIELKKRRQSVLERVRKHRQKKQEESHCSTTRSQCKKPAPALVVKLDFNKKRVKKRKEERALKRAQRTVSSLTEKVEELKKTSRKLRKRLQRSTSNTKKSTRIDSSPTDSLVGTPRTRTKRQLKRAKKYGCSYEPSIKKRLLFANTMAAEIREGLKANKQQKSSSAVLRVVAGKITKKYRMLSSLSKELGVNKKRLKKATSKSIKEQKRQRLQKKKEEIDEKVLEFLHRDDNSRMMPGKGDAKKCGKEKFQKRILCDYLHNLHQMFLAENPDIKISRAAFCRLRPTYMETAAFTSRSVCLCQKHQNMSLKLRALKSARVVVTTNPDQFIKDVERGNEDEVLVTIKCNNVIYDEWKRVSQEDGKKKMMIVTAEVTKSQFQKLVKQEILQFRDHVERVNKQYLEVRKLKDNLPPGHVMLQMDFAENYLCQTVEVQSAYWNQTMVTLHPVVAYYRNHDNSLLHKSYVFVSDELTHDSSTVIAFLRTLVPKIQDFLPVPLIYVHYWTDSPTSQYRNKTIFLFISNHKDEFGVCATWNFFEAGHGKGPCDGVGGTAKRLADHAVRSNKAQIQSAEQSFNWVDKENGSSALTYLFVPKNETSKARQKIQSSLDSLKTVQGTMKLHAVAGVSTGKVSVRETSCYCSNYHTKEGFTGTTTCDWRLQMVSLSALSNNITIKEGDWVAAIYEDQWYLGQVEEYDEEDCHINFMETISHKNSDKKFKWPARTDKVWVKRKYVICVIEQPSKTGKSSRSPYTIPSAVEVQIEHRFMNRKGH